MRCSIDSGLQITQAISNRLDQCQAAQAVIEMFQTRAEAAAIKSKDQTHFTALVDEMVIALDGVEVAWEELFGFTWCSSQRATAYRPVHRQERTEIDLWREPLAVGQSLPTLPLAVRGLGCLPIDLEATYMEARQRGRIG